MATQINDVQRYRASPADVFAMLCDPAFIERKGEASGSIEVSADVESEGDSVVLVSRRVLPAKLPSFAKSLVGETITLIETQKWGPASQDGSRAAKFHVDFGKNPISFNGEITLSEDGADTTLTTTGVIKASVPLFSGKIEAVALDWTRRYLRKELSVGTEWLAADQEQGP